MSEISRNDACPCGSGMKYKRCHLGKVFTFQSERVTVSATRNGKVHKLFKITFHHKQGTDKASIIISFPYHKNSRGLLSSVTFPKDTKKINKLSLVPGGKVTSHRVKYSHWRDGNVHFSQDGKIYSLRKTPSDELDKDIGHIFTISIKGVGGFEKKVDVKRYSQKEIDLSVDLRSDEDDSLKITGWWHDLSAIHPKTNEYKRIYIYKQDDGPTNVCFAIQPPPNSPLANKVLFLCARKEFMTKEKGTHLLFLGGFDQSKIAKDIHNDLHFLAMKYPARNYKKLLNEIGTVDLTENLHSSNILN